MRKLLLGLSLFIALAGFGQTVVSTKFATANGLVYRPKGFDSTLAYNALIDFPGAGEIGTNAALLSAHGPFQYLKNGVDIGANILVIAVQTINPNSRPSEIAAYLAAVKAQYRINKIVATGLSRGGQDWDWYMGNSESQFAQIAGLVIFSGEGPVTDMPGIPGSWTPSLFLKYNVPYWFGIGTQDPFYDANKSRYKSIAALNPKLATWTEWAGAGHGDPVWSDGYNPAWTNNSLKMSIYQWTASITGSVAPPVIVPVIYKSIAETATYSKACTCGTPSLVTYSVPAGKYTSTVSQAQADSLATVDMLANGQAYANANGTCTPVLVTTHTITIAVDSVTKVTLAIGIMSNGSITVTQQ